MSREDEKTLDKLAKRIVEVLRFNSKTSKKVNDLMLNSHLTDPKIIWPIVARKMLANKKLPEEWRYTEAFLADYLFKSQSMFLEANRQIKELA